MTIVRAFVPAFVQTSLLVATWFVAVGAHAQLPDENRSSARSGHPNTGEYTPGLGSPASGVAGSTGGSHTPGTSASGAAVDCPKLTTEIGEGTAGNVSTGRPGLPQLAPNRPTSASTYCNDHPANAASGKSGAEATTSNGTGRTAQPQEAPAAR